jgi:hypothetical protein
MLLFAHVYFNRSSRLGGSGNAIDPIGDIARAHVPLCPDHLRFEALASHPMPCAPP